MSDSQIPDETLSRLQGLIQSQLVETGVPSLALAVAREGEIIWEEGFGWADRENRIPATPHTLYSLASITKPITATGLMVLAERNLIDLDRPADDYLGEAKLSARAGDAKDATLRRIASHTGGLPLHYHFFFEDEGCKRPHMDETIRRYGVLVTPPGETYRYANLGYGILDYIISRVSGETYPDFIRREVFIPLNMPRASIGIGPGLGPHCAVRYTRNGVPLPFYDFDHPGGSAAFCSANDLARFGMFHLKAHLPDQRAILSDGAIDAMQTLEARIGDRAGYGIGWFVLEDDNGLHAVRHDGSMPGVRTRLYLVPSESLAVAVLVNTHDELPVRIASEILAALLPEYAEHRAKREAEKAQDGGEPSPFRPGPELLGAWQGAVYTYRGEVPFTLEFQEDGDIHARLGDQLETLVNDPRFENAALTGRMVGDVGTEDAGRLPYHLHLSLNLRGDLLNGAVSAISLPNLRSGNALSYWTELKKRSK